MSISTMVLRANGVIASDASASGSILQKKGVQFSGRIVDANGVPMKEVMISLPAGGMQTDEDGAFCIDNVGPMLGNGRDRGTFTILVPGKSWYVKQSIQNLDIGGEKAVALGDITVPESIASTGIKGRIEGDESLFPRTLRMVSEDGSIEALVAVRRDGVFVGNDYPAGSYILSNTTVAGTPNPKTAQRQTYKVSLVQGQTTDLVFAVSKASASQEH